MGRAGLIIKAPTANVVLMSSQDAGAPVMNKKALKELAQRHRLLTADQLLQETPATQYNEVVTLANGAELAGFFYKVTEDGKPTDDALYRQMRAHALRLNMPIIPILEPSPYAENKVNRDDGRPKSVQYGGRLYPLRDKPTVNFRVYGRGKCILFASPEEMGQILQFLRKEGVESAEIEAIQKEYEEADRMRQRPTITYDPDGTSPLLKREEVME